MKLINTTYTHDSILLKKDEYVPITIGIRPRLATCTAVCWLTENIIASLNLYGNRIITYKYNETNNQLEVWQEVKNEDGAKLSMSEHISISNNGKLIAVCSAPPLYKPTPKAGVNIYRFDKNTNLINPVPIFSIDEPHLVHNVRFSPDDKKISYVTYDDGRAINTYNIVDDGTNFSLTPISIKQNDFLPKKPKAINFTKDNKFAIVPYCISLVNLKTEIESCLVCYKVLENGSLGGIVYVLNQNLGMEDVVFSKEEDFFYSSDQMNDFILKYSFNKTTGEIKYVKNFNPDNTISFPHGISISFDGKKLALANYGGDKVNIYEL